MSKNKIAILTYHALHAPAWEYDTNDHVALESDLQSIKKMDLEIVSLNDIALMLSGKKQWVDKPSIALSFDDGTNHDFIDFSHPDYGYLKSMFTLLNEASTEHFKPKATSFVIASPKARDILDKTCIAGRGEWQDNWWLDAAKSGILDIANHSWDHTHESLPEVIQADKIKGRFDHIDNYASANLQIKKAQDYLIEKLGEQHNGLFAYPYGHSNEFLVNEYFPQNSDIFSAAFITGGDYVTPNTNKWRIPRFVCGENWNSANGLEKILIKLKST